MAVREEEKSTRRARPGGRRLTTPVRQVIGVVVIGSVMSLLDSTIVNVALRSLSVDLHAPIATVQWVVTAYLLSLAAAIPVSGWAATRFGARRVYVVALALFTTGSLLCGLAQTPGQLIGFRVLQGIGGGLLSPVGQAILIRTAGPANMARVMSVLGVPTVLAPVFGPTIGGLLIDGAGWRSIFFVNVPFGIVAVLLAIRLLPRVPAQDAGRLDLPGLALVSTGLVGVAYALAGVGSAGRVVSPDILAPLIVGLALLACFVVRSLRVRRPLLALHLFRDRVFGAASLSIFCLSAALFGGMILMPLYYQGVRHDSAIVAGLLLAPGGIGGAVATWASGRIVERLGSGVTALAGAVVSAAATLPFAFITDRTSYPLLSVMLAVRGVGIGLTLMPAMVAAYRVLSPTEINTATPQLSVLQRVGASLGTAIFAAVLQANLPAADGRPEVSAAAYAATFWWVTSVAAITILPAALLAVAERRARAADQGPEPERRREHHALHRR